ncbi:Mobile element protein [Richelia intracellularis]|nr:Mobile element protein [Richelia intracellularis]
MERINLPPISLTGVAESGDDFTKFSTIYQWFQTLIHPLIQQRPLTQ